MKNLHFYILLLFVSSLSFSQGWYDFEDGTLQGWSNTDGSTDFLTNEEETSSSQGRYLQKISDGTNTAVGQMAIAVVTGPWIGDNSGGGFFIFGYFIFSFNNNNDFDIHLRLGFRGGDDNTILVSTDAVIIPANSNWAAYDLETFGNTTIISGSNSRLEVQEDTQEMRIIHNQEISFDGQEVNGVFNIDGLNGIYLDTQDFQKEEISLFPNPVKDEITFKFAERSSGTITFYNILGEKVLSKEFSTLRKRIDLSELTSGVYFVNIKTEKATISKKIIKL